MTTPKPLLIVKLGASLPDLAARRGDFEDWFIATLGLGRSLVRVCDPRGSSRWPDLTSLSGIVLTGSHSMVTERQPWSERAASWLRGVVGAGVPVLGVCYGHQLLAHALGGVVGDNPRGTQEGTTTIALSDEARRDPLLGQLPPRFDAQVSHSQSVLELPEGAVRLASDDWDRNQAVRFADAAWGVQFHPEMDADMTRAYIHASSSTLAAEGQDVAALLSSVRETPVAATLVARFATLCRAAL